MNEVSLPHPSLTGLKPKIIKVQSPPQSTSSLNANKMAQLQLERVKQHQTQKRQKIQHFMNNTRINANRLYKQQCSKNLSSINQKKQQLVKLKSLKSKYTIVNNKKCQKIQRQEHILQLPKLPIQVNWKQAQDALKIIHPPIQNIQIYQQSDNQSGYDSQINNIQQQTPQSILLKRQNIRKSMNQKFKKL